MTDTKRRLVDRILESSYAEGLESKSLEELRALSDECREGETELSFERRLCQARIDILEAEVQRRKGGTDSDLLKRLPEILATETRVESDIPLPSRAPDFSIPRNADVPRRRVEEIVGEQTLARLGTLPVEEVESILESLRTHEGHLSTKRRGVHEVLDRITAALIPLYRERYGLTAEDDSGS